jgi:hypothetical protein
VVAAAALGVAVANVPAQPAEAALANGTFDPRVGPLGPITVIGDSVLQGSVIYSPTLSDHLVGRGWGPVRVRAGVGYSTGFFSTTTEAKATYWIGLWRSTGWNPRDVVVNLGANDSGRCVTNLTCARDAITHLVDAIGPDHRIWWPKITRHPLFGDQADNWNLALEQIATERDNVFTWDWPTVMATEGYRSYDNTHLDVIGYRQRSERMAKEITADLGAATRFGDDAPLPVATGAPSELVPIGPTRIIDTRIDPPGRLAERTEIVVDVSSEIPPGTTAVAAYVSATNAGGDGFLTAYECSAGRPNASTANYRRFETRGAVAITPVSPEGTFCLYTREEADVLVDLQAAFVPAGSGGSRLTPLDTPQRLVDTRESGRREILEVAVPPGADVAAVSITAVLGERPGYLVAYPCSEDVPTVATVNHLSDEVISGAAFVPVGPDGTICVWSLNPVDVTVDLTGVFSGDGALAYVPAAPTRTLDTRFATGGWGPIHGRFQIIDARVAPPEAEAVSGTLTIVTPLRPGFLRAWGCGAEPDTANVTSLTDGVLANMVTTGVSDAGRLCFVARAATSTLFDTTGWWVAGA